MLQSKIEILPEKYSLGRAAADHAACSLRQTLGDQGSARLVAATGAWVFEFLDALISAPGIDWSRVEVFHLDEYVGLPSTHPASFRKYLFERLIHKVGITSYYLLDGDGDPQGSVTKLGLHFRPNQWIFFLPESERMGISHLTIRLRIFRSLIRTSSLISTRHAASNR